MSQNYLNRQARPLLVPKFTYMTRDQTNRFVTMEDGLTIYPWGY